MVDKYKKVENYYGSVSKIYDHMYDIEKLHTSEEYMADWFRYNLIIKRLKDLGIKGNILDIGCGEATPLIEICKSTNLSPHAFDVTDQMVVLAKKQFKENNFNDQNVMRANISDIKSFDDVYEDNYFNASLCLGVMPHVPDVLVALKNIRKKMSKGSVSYISFRNLLFSLFTMNRYSKDFFINILMDQLNEDELKKIEEDFNKRFAIQFPPVREKNKAGGIGYDTIPAEFHNPLTIRNIAKEAGFTDSEIYFYHFHPTPPMYENSLVTKESFRQMSINMEKNPSDWRGHFMCSAFLLELKV